MTAVWVSVFKYPQLLNTPGTYSWREHETISVTMQVLDDVHGLSAVVSQLLEFPSISFKK